MNLYKSFPWIYARSRFVSKLPSKGALLDVGCGPGDFFGFFKKIKPGWNYAGTDVERHKLFPASLNFFQSDVSVKLSTQSDKYDAVVCTHVFEHIKNPRQAIKEISRVLKLGGRLYLETPSERSVHVPSFLCVPNPVKSPLNFYDDPTHIRPFSPNSLEHLCIDAGLVVRKRGYVRHLLALVASPITLIMGLVLRDRNYISHAVWHTVGWAAYVVAEKPMTSKKK